MLCSGTVQENPPPRLVAMVVPTMLYVFAVELLVMDVLRYFEYPLPFRISSLPKGTQVRPGIYSIIEDVVCGMLSCFLEYLLLTRHCVDCCRWQRWDGFSRSSQ